MRGDNKNGIMRDTYQFSALRSNSTNVSVREKPWNDVRRKVKDLVERVREWILIRLSRSVRSIDRSMEIADGEENMARIRKEGRKEGRKDDWKLKRRLGGRPRARDVGRRPGVEKSLRRSGRPAGMKSTPCISAGES